MFTDFDQILYGDCRVPCHNCHTVVFFLSLFCPTVSKLEVAMSKVNWSPASCWPSGFLNAKSHFLVVFSLEPCDLAGPCSSLVMSLCPRQALWSCVQGSGHHGPRVSLPIMPGTCRQIHHDLMSSFWGHLGGVRGSGPQVGFENLIVSL